jgi:hypothetical protein
MMKSKRSAVMFANIMMILFYSSIFGIMLGIWITISNQKVDILFYISCINLMISIIGSCLTIRTDNLECESNIIHKAIWIWNN